MSQGIDPKLIDRRTVARYLERGQLNDREYEKYLKSLPDLAEQAVPVTSELPEKPRNETLH
jgi:hypothetical protein